MIELSWYNTRPPYGRPPIGGIPKIQLLNFQFHQLKKFARVPQENFSSPSPFFFFSLCANCKIQSNWILESLQSYRIPLWWFIVMHSRPPYGRLVWKPIGGIPKIQLLNFQFCTLKKFARVLQENFSSPSPFLFFSLSANCKIQSNWILESLQSQ
jgi:hypothetical protein